MNQIDQIQYEAAIQNEGNQQIVMGALMAATGTAESAAAAAWIANDLAEKLVMAPGIVVAAGGLALAGYGVFNLVTAPLQARMREEGRRIPGTPRLQGE